MKEEQSIMCQYPKCKKEATHSLGLNDPDSEPNYYCEEHCRQVKINTIMKIREFRKEQSNETGEGK